MKSQSPFHMLFLVSHFWKCCQAHTSRNMSPHPPSCSPLVSRETSIQGTSYWASSVTSDVMFQRQLITPSLSHKATTCSFILCLRLALCLCLHLKYVFFHPAFVAVFFVSNVINLYVRHSLFSLSIVFSFKSFVVLFYTCSVLSLFISQLHTHTLTHTHQRHTDTCTCKV